VENFIKVTVDNRHVSTPQRRPIPNIQIINLSTPQINNSTILTKFPVHFLCFTPSLKGARENGFQYLDSCVLHPTEAIIVRGSLLGRGKTRAMKAGNPSTGELRNEDR
jgi:hypothetical protein